MKNEDLKIAIIGFYYGNFPLWMQYWLKSCADNPTIDFLIVTDIEISNLPSNVKTIKKTFDECKILFTNKLGFDVSLEKPYKLCDYRPAYGILLDEYIKDYDYWGHCDFDLIWGDIRKFVVDYDLIKYDKFLPLGHLALYRNTPEVNNYYMLEGSNCGDYKTVFTSPDNYAFDETAGIYSIYEHNNLPMFTKRIFAEIKTFHKRFRLKKMDKNYKYQLFYYSNGKVLRAYENGNKIELQEYVYIHFRRKLSIHSEKKWNEINSFALGPDGIFDINDDEVTKEAIKKFNNYPGLLVEMLETLVFCMKNVTKIKSKIENELVAKKMN